MARAQRDQRPGRRGRRATDRKDPELVEFGRRLRELRDAAGLTQEDLADAAGLHWTYVGQIERGERNLTYKNILRLARGLDVQPGALIGP
ncbi:MAG TPA: helix-turn-helix transcriptional regulator [Solirubrobacterales bacterium]|jgi:transcriptional regulator with XRE-family HTH domain